MPIIDYGPSPNNITIYSVAHSIVRLGNDTVCSIYELERQGVEAEQLMMALLTLA
jgi:hypothetical protein